MYVSCTTLIQNRFHIPQTNCSNWKLQISHLREAMKIEKIRKLNKRDDFVNILTVWKTIMKNNMKTTLHRQIQNIQWISNGEEAPPCLATVPTNQMTVRYNLRDIGNSYFLEIDEPVSKCWTSSHEINGLIWVKNSVISDVVPKVRGLLICF